MGYEVEEDLIPPDRCHCDDHPDSCEDCYNYNKEYGLINDENFALSYIKSNPNYSANKLKQKLFNFGVKKQIVDLVLNDFDNYEGCEKCAVKFMKNKDHTQKTKEKLIRHLLGKGYNWNDIGKVLNLFDFEYDHFEE